MEKRIGNRPFKTALPIWAWCRYEKKKPKPDLRYGGYLKRGEQGVRLEIEKEDKILQATFWKLYISEVKDITYFKAR